MSLIARLLPDNPVLTKELRVRMRGARAYWILFGYLGFLALVLLFQYAAFLDSVRSTGSGASDVLIAHHERSVTDADFAKRATLFVDDTPTTKSGFAYRRLFEEMFPGEARRKTVGRWRGHARSVEKQEPWRTTS